MYTKKMRLDVTVNEDVFGRNPHNNDKPDKFGIEVELEGRNIRNPGQAVMDVWEMHNDGSLRAVHAGDETIEYVFRRGMEQGPAEQAVRDLYAYLNTPPAVVYDSYRTSIHVHINCLQETQRTVANYLTLAVIFDELLVSQNGDSRIGNNFCLRAKDAEGFINNLVRNVEERGNIYAVGREERYSSINICSLAKFGTIEFRSLECTTDVERLLDWMRVLQKIKTEARVFSDPREIIAAYSANGAIGFMRNILGNHAMKYEGIQGCEEMLQRGMRLAQDFAFCSTWQAAPAEVRRKTRDGADAVAEGGLIVPRGPDRVRDQLQDIIDRDINRGIVPGIIADYRNRYYLDENNQVRRRPQADPIN